MFKTFAATLGILLLASTAGEASVRNFFAPVVDGSRIDNCLKRQGRLRQTRRRCLLREGRLHRIHPVPA